jgi:hypothetical protein
MREEVKKREGLLARWSLSLISCSAMVRHHRHKMHHPAGGGDDRGHVPLMLDSVHVVMGEIQNVLAAMRLNRRWTASMV